MNDAFIWVRSVHFASTILLAGTVFFIIFVAEPALRPADDRDGVRATVHSRLGWIVWFSMFLTVTSGVVWFFFLTARIADLPLSDILSDQTIWIVLRQTDFGQDWIARLVLAGLLCAVLVPRPYVQLIDSYWRKRSAMLLSAAIVGTLAWAGHAAAGTGFDGAVHLTSDTLHLIAASAWLGALVPLAVLLGAAARGSGHASTAIAGEAALRFSTIGVTSVGTLVATGLVNSWMLVGSVEALTGTRYGRLLLAKIVLFLVMLSIAGFNRLILTPRLLRAKAGAEKIPVRQLRNNSLIEAALGAAILVIVGILGTLPPGILEQAPG